MSVITLTGPTCAGKTTIERELQRLGCGRAISHTTRSPRTGEKNGHDYHFVSPDEFKRMVLAGEFIEIVELGPKRYGMSKGSLREAQLVSLNTAIVVDPHGAAQIRAYCEANEISVFSVWVDCGVKEQARRFMQRAILEQQQGGTNVAGIYAERLELMLSEETSWRSMASRDKIDGTWDYHKKLRSTDGFSPKELASSILWSLPTPYTPVNRAGVHDQKTDPRATS